MSKTFRRFLNDADQYVIGHIYALEANTVNDLFAEYQRSYHNMAIALEAVQQRYGVGETWSASDSQYRQRTQALMEQIMAEMRALTNRVASKSEQAAMQAYYAGLYGKAWAVDVAAGGIRIPVLPAEAVRAAIMKPYEGNTFVDRFLGKDDDFQARIRKSIVQSQINGETMYQAQKRIANELGLNIDRRRKADKQAHSRDFNRTQMIARTEIIRTSNLGAHAVYEQNKDILTGWEWKATEDDRTCPVCGDLDGQQFTFKDKQNPPPAHPSCRCTSISVFKNQDMNDLVRGDVPTFKEWAIRNGIQSNVYGQVFDFAAQKPPKSSTKSQKDTAPVDTKAVVDNTNLPTPVSLQSPGAKAMMSASPEPYEAESDKWARKLSNPEKKSIVDYMKEKYVEIKEKLATGKIDAQVKNFLAAIEKAPPVKDITYRGESGGKLTQTQLEEKWTRAIGTQVDRSEPLSVSLDPEIASRFRGQSGIVLQIMSNRGRYINALTQREEEDNEYEAVMLPGTKFKVISAGEKQIMTRRGYKTVFVVQVEDVTYG